MLEIVIVAVIGTVIAGVWDLKTTEVPDNLVYALVGVGILYWLANWIVTGNIELFATSIAVGSLLLAAGLLMYWKKQWGGADAWILAAIGYMIPVYSGGLFIIPYLMNLALVSIFYTLAYALVVGARSPSVFRRFAVDVGKNKIYIAVVPIAFAVLAAAAAYYNPAFVASVISMMIIMTLLVVFWRYAVAVEKFAFKKKVSTSRLKVGDVVEGSRWVGLTGKQIANLRRQKKYVVVKDGMRFVPVFAIALVLTLLYGNLFFAVL